MCSRYNLEGETNHIEETFNAEFDGGLAAEIEMFANGYAHPLMPVITNEQPNKIQSFTWGLIPSWVKDAEKAKEMANMCIMAKIETIEEKPSFRDSFKHKRCIVPATSFFEWKWLDSKGKHKELYEISLSSHELFALGGLWSTWTNNETGEILNTFNIITTNAVGLMEEIHNTKKRMPLILKPDQINEWLKTPKDLHHLSELTHHQTLEAFLIEPLQNTLF